jgi:hypothetical protein
MVSHTRICSQLLTLSVPLVYEQSYAPANKACCALRLRLPVCGQSEFIGVTDNVNGIDCLECRAIVDKEQAATP